MPEFVRSIPAGDTMERQVCSSCGYVAYEKPKVGVGSVVSDNGNILLCRRAMDGVLALYNVSRIGQVQIMYRARFAKPGIAAGEESLEVCMFAWDDIPWGSIAFPTVHWALHAWRDLDGRPLGAPAGNPAEDRRGASRLDGAAAL